MEEYGVNYEDIPYMVTGLSNDDRDELQEHMDSMHNEHIQRQGNKKLYEQMSCLFYGLLSRTLKASQELVVELAGD